MPRELDPREREPPLFARDGDDRLPEVLEPERELDVDFFAALFDRDALVFAAPDDRLEPVPDDLARDGEAAFFAPLDREPEVDEREVPLADRFDELEPVALRVPLERELPRPEELEELDPPDLLEPLVPPHLPDITRSAASATASAMSEPSLVALDTTLLAARSAVSAASRPASRIFLRAAGLALIAAAAAARPAASISLLIAALASLSVMSLLFELFEPDPEDFVELLRADLAIA